MNALREVPPSDVLTVIRGCKRHASTLGGQCIKGEEFVWSAFSSTATTVDVMQTFLGKSGPRTLFMLTLQPGIGRCVKDFSLFPTENEVILPPNTEFEVVATVNLGHELTQVQCKQIESLDMILDMSEGYVASPPALAPAPKRPIDTGQNQNPNGPPKKKSKKTSTKEGKGKGKGKGKGSESSKKAAKAKAPVTAVHGVGAGGTGSKAASKDLDMDPKAKKEPNGAVKKQANSADTSDSDDDDDVPLAQLKKQAALAPPKTKAPVAAAHGVGTGSTGGAGGSSTDQVGYVAHECIFKCAHNSLCSSPPVTRDGFRVACAHWASGCKPAIKPRRGVEYAASIDWLE
jgi:hypothetical protein